MDPDRLRLLLEGVATRRTSVDDAVRELRELPFRSLGFAHADTHRYVRTGFPEVVLGEGKTPEQIAAILAELARGGSTVLATRVSPEAAAVVQAAHPAARHYPVPRAIVIGPVPPPDPGRGTIAVVTAGTADIP